MKSTPATDFNDLPARERILRTAHDLFYSDGIRATGIDRVIAQAGVSKVTFYRHFPSKNQLIFAFLEYRHQRWINWFVEALHRHGNTPDALLPTLAEWFDNGGYRGCAFINTVVELGEQMPEVTDISVRHKQDMVVAIASLLPASAHRQQLALAIALAVDGAIIRAQFDQSAAVALQALADILQALLAQAQK
jgi:AcrR family transcriptional regulator